MSNSRARKEQGAMSGTPAPRASDGAGPSGPAQGGAAAARSATGQGSGEKLGHATWHSPASPVPPGQPSQGRNSRTYDLAPEPPRPSMSERKTSFNMRGLLKSVSMHGFRRRGPADTSAMESTDISEMSAKGWMLEKEGKLGEAELMYSRHCVRSQKNHGKDSMVLARDLDRLVGLLRKEGKLEDAEPLCRRSLDIKLKSLGEENIEVATALINLGRVLDDKGSYADALANLRNGLSIRESLLGERHPDTITALAWVGDVHCKREEYEEALTIARRVAEAYEASLGPTDIKVASSLNNVGGLLATLGRSDEALPMFTRAHGIYVQNLGDQHPRAVAAHLWIQQLSTPQPLPQPRPRRRSPPPRTQVRGRRSPPGSDRDTPAVIEEVSEESVSGHVSAPTPEDQVVPPVPPAASGDKAQAEGVTSHPELSGDVDT